MDRLRQDLRYSLRALARAPGFTAVAVLTIALGIAATTVIFSLVSTLLLRPLPVAAPERLVTVSEVQRGSTHVIMGYSAFSVARYEAFREATRSVFAGLAGHSYGEGSLRTDNRGAEVVNTVAATANYFDVLGLRPAAGSFFSPAANRSGEAAVVISHGLWAARFGSDPAVVGRTVHLNSRPYTVAGVAPQGFSGTIVGLPVDVWHPARAGSGEPGSGEVIALFGRLREGVEPEAARAALAAVSRQLPPDRRGAEVVGVRVQPLTAVPGFFRGVLIGFMGMLLATALLVLLIASANVGGMLLARGAARRREMAIRLAVGAGRGRIVRQLLTESVILFLAGGGLGVLMTVWLMGLISGFQPPVPVRIALEFGVDGRVLAFACALALATGVVFGLAPALQATRAEVVPGLRDGERGQTAGRTRMRSGFVVAQLSLSLLLLVTAALFGRTLQKALADEIGFNPDGVVVTGINLESHGYDEARGLALQQQLLERLRAAPGVQSAAYAVWAPMGGNVWSERIRRADREGEEAEVTADLGTVGEGYFETMQIPLAAGRAFTSADRPGAPATAVVNETLARRLWPGQSPLGRTLRFQDRVLEVVGVARDGKYESYTETPKSFVYLPLSQRYAGSVTLHVRSRDGDAAAALGTVRREMAALDPNVALEQAMSLPALIGFSIFPQRMAATLVGAFGLVGLLLAAIGLYGILAFQVSSRTREIGIRMALGAAASDVVRGVVRSSLRLLALGTAVGLALALAATRLLSSLLYGVTATDPVTFVGVPLLLAVVALVASYLPARRATRVDPMVALRAE